MSSPDDSPSIKQADQVRRTLFKRPLFIVLFLLVFIITDMLCATDLFPFVKCIR